MSSSSHCWVCYDDGGLYMVTGISECCSPGPGSPKVKLKWTKVDSGFRNVYAGYDGLVCAIKQSSLWVRTGVTCECPMGDDWIRYVCDVIKVMAGRTCIVRKSAKGKLHFARISQKQPEVLLDWKFVPAVHEQDCSKDEEDHFYAVNGSDRLFCVTEIGTVSCCNLLSEEDLCWTPVTGPPKMDKGLLGWISSKLWTSSSNSSCSSSNNGSGNSSNGGWVSGVSFGLGSLWCLKEGSNQVWQLVTGQLNDTLRVNWAVSEFPLLDEEETVSIAACKSSKDGLYLIVKEQGHYKIVSYSLNNSGRTEIALPTRSPCRCIAISSISFRLSKYTPVTSVQALEKSAEDVYYTVEAASESRKRLPSDISSPYAPLAKKIKADSPIEGIEVQYKHHRFLTNDFGKPEITNLSQEDLNKICKYDFLLERSFLK